MHLLKTRLSYALNKALNPILHGLSDQRIPHVGKEVKNATYITL